MQHSTHTMQPINRLTKRETYHRKKSVCAGFFDVCTGNSHRSCRTRCRRDAARYHRHTSKTSCIKCALFATSLSHQSRQACRQRADSMLCQRVKMLRTIRSCCCFRTEALRAMHSSASIVEREAISYGHCKLRRTRDHSSCAMIP
jgi:hypothetical protein